MAEGTGEFFDLSVKPIYRDKKIEGRKMRRTVIMLFSFFCPR